MNTATTFDTTSRKLYLTGSAPIGELAVNFFLTLNYDETVRVVASQTLIDGPVVLHDVTVTLSTVKRSIAWGNEGPYLNVGGSYMVPMAECQADMVRRNWS